MPGSLAKDLGRRIEPRSFGLELETFDLGRVGPKIETFDLSPMLLTGRKSMR